MKSLCSDLQGKALQSCCVFCLCSQSRQTVSTYNRGIGVALYRISLINWRREAVLACVANGVFTPLHMGTNQQSGIKESLSASLPGIGWQHSINTQSSGFFPGFPVLQHLVANFLLPLTTSQTYQSLYLLALQCSSLQN